MLVDIDLGPESGFDVAHRLSGEHGVGVLLISAYTESEFRGADRGRAQLLGFISKTDLSASRVTAMLNATPPYPKP